MSILHSGAAPAGATLLPRTRQRETGVSRLVRGQGSIAQSRSDGCEGRTVGGAETETRIPESKDSHPSNQNRNGGETRPLDSLHFCVSSDIRISISIEETPRMSFRSGWASSR